MKRKAPGQHGGREKQKEVFVNEVREVALLCRPNVAQKGEPVSILTSHPAHLPPPSRLITAREPAGVV